MNRYLAFATVLVLVIGAGVLHGLESHRWGKLDPGPTTGNVAGLPRTIGAWVGRDLEMDPRQLARGGIEAACARRYERQTTGTSLLLLLVCGPTGPITVHTPDLCYPGIGYEIVGAPTRQTLNVGQSVEFRAVRARKAEPGRVSYLRLLWAWNAGNGWEAPDYPRLAFRHAPSLYKLYIVQEMSAPDEPLLNDDSADFLRSLLPAIDPILFRRAAAAK